MPCPNGLNIPANFEFFNYAHLYDNVADARFRYGLFLTEAQRASACIACGLCEEKCPQKIVISEQMTKVAALLG
jgi:predicted aldo/keto reductase-like oxidoreductase